MSDLDSYLLRCYDLLLQQDDNNDHAELCACARLVAKDEPIED